MIKSTLSGKAPRDEVYRQYPAGLDNLIYQLAQLQDSGKLNEDTYPMYINMFTDKLREDGHYESIDYLRSVFKDRKNNNNDDSDDGEEKK